MIRHASHAPCLRLATLALPLLFALGCGKNNDVSPDAPKDNAVVVERPVIEGTRPKGVELVALTAETGERPNVIYFNVLNQTDNDLPIRPEYFGLIIRDQQRPRPYKRGRDRGDFPTTFVPKVEIVERNGKQEATGGQVAGRIEWGGGVPPLAGSKLVFNPEGTGFPPVFCVIDQGYVAPPTR